MHAARTAKMCMQVENPQQQSLCRFKARTDARILARVKFAIMQILTSLITSPDGLNTAPAVCRMLWPHSYASLHLPVQTKATPNSEQFPQHYIDF